MSTIKISAHRIVEVLSHTHSTEEDLISITVKDVIDTVYHNEKKRDAEAVRRVFQEILKIALEDANHIIETYMVDILREINH